MDKNQQDAVERALNTLTKAFPELRPIDILQGPLAETVLGPLPDYSNLPHYRMTNVPVAMQGSAQLAHFVDPETNERMIVIGERLGRFGELLYCGTGGGFSMLDFLPERVQATVETAEQPNQNAERERQEEIRYPDGAPVLVLDPERQTLFDGGVDYRSIARGGLPTCFYVFHVELTAEEAATIKAHCYKLATDEEYRQLCKAATGGETENVRIMKISEAVAIPLEKYAHPHEGKAVAKLFRILTGEAGLVRPEPATIHTGPAREIA